MKSNSIALADTLPLRIPVNYSSMQTKVFLFVASLLAMFLFCTLSAEAATTYYVRAGATGANNGSDWTNAFTTLPATLVRGATYYIADGSYGGYTFDDPDSGTSYIYIKKAISSNHGTDTGWSPTYGDGTAVFTYWYLRANYYDIDGQVGQWADFFPNYVPYGIQVSRTTTGDNQRVVQIGSSGNPYSHLVFKHIEIKHGNTPRTGTWHRGTNNVWGYGSYWVFQYCWIHDAGAVNILALAVNNGLVDKCAIGRNGHAQVAMNFNPSSHSENIMLQPNTDNWTFQNSYFYDWRSTGNWMLYGGNDNIVFTGNVVFTTGYWAVPGESGDSDGVFGACMHGDAYGACTNNKVVNNTFVNIPYGGRIGQLSNGGITGLKIENNLFYNVKVYGSGSIGLPSPSYRQNNWYYNCGTFASETGQQNGSGNPFIDISMYNFNLSSATNPGLIWASSPYNIDPNGQMRGEDTNWDRGAFEHASGGSSTRPAPPLNLR